MKKYILLLLAALFFSCGETKEVPKDYTGDARISGAVKNYLDECPGFFIPPVFGNLSGTMKNLTGAVAWTPSGLTGNPPKVENKNGYIGRINKATRKDITQQNWNEYICTTDDCGYPVYIDGGVDIPTLRWQAGFVCFALVYRAYIDAGYTGWTSPPTSINNLLSKFEELTNLTVAGVGDVAAFDWDGNGVYDHVGIITKKDNNTSNIRNWTIVSSLGVVEIFEYGAKSTRLGVFGTTNGGEFTSWRADWENWEWAIFGYKTNL